MEELEVMQVPLQLSFHNIEKTEKLKQLVRKKTKKLDRFHNHISSCRVLIELDQKHNTANPYRVRINITIPPGHEIAVVEKSKKGSSRLNVATIVRRAFKVTCKQVLKIKKKQKGEVKTHFH